MMKTCRFLFLLGSLLGLSGCPETPCFDGGDTSVPPPGANSGVSLVGEEVRMHVSPILSDACGKENPERPSSLTVEVSDPDNLTVPSEAALGNPSSSAATVVFTPDKPGRYHVFAAFAPVGGIQQFDLHAARNRSAEAPVHTMNRTCGSLERTKRGGWVCDSHFLRDGAVVRQFTDTRLAVAGDVVWAVSPSQTQRFVDSGTALELTATLTGGSRTTQTLIASETELLAIRTPGVDRIVFDGTSTLALKGSEFIPVFSGTIGSTDLQSILLRSGNQLLVITRAPSSTSGQPTDSFTSQACPYRIEPDRIVRGTEPCQRFTGDVVGYEPTGLWVGTLSSARIVSELRWLEFTGGSLTEQATLPLGTNFQLPKHLFALRNTAIPVISAPRVPFDSRVWFTVPVYAADQRAVLLEFLDAEMPDPSASTSFLWGPSRTAPMRIRVRPTTP